MDLDIQPEFDEEQFELEKYWIKQREAGKLFRAETKVDSLFSIIGSAVGWTLIFGSFLAIFFIYFFPYIYVIPIPYILVFYIFFRKFREPYSVLEVDSESDNILYDGIIEYAGKMSKIRYLGSYEMIMKTQIIGKKLPQYYRFINEAGYLRVTIVLPAPVKLRLMEMDVIPEDDKFMKVLYHLNGWNIFYEMKFDRSEFYNKLREKKKKKIKERTMARTKKMEEEYLKQLENGNKELSDS